MCLERWKGISSNWACSVLEMFCLILKSLSVAHEPSLFVPFIVKLELRLEP